MTSAEHIAYDMALECVRGLTEDEGLDICIRIARRFGWNDSSPLWEFLSMIEGARCAVCLNGRPEIGWVEEAPHFVLCSQRCANAYTANPNSPSL